MAQITAEMVLDVARLNAGAAQAERRIRRIGESGEASGRRLSQGLARGFAGEGGGAGGGAGTMHHVLSRQFSLLATMIAAASTGTAIWGAHSAEQAVEVAAHFEMLRLKVGQFTGSLEMADKMLAEAAQFGIVTPFETHDIEQVMAKLLSAGIAVNNVMRDVKALAAVSRDGQQLQELGDALSKGFAKGKFSLEELNKFLERGVNLLPELSKATGLYGTELTKAISDGKIGYTTMMQALVAMSAEGGQFFGLLERQSRTTEGLFSTLSGAIMETRREFGKPISDALKPIFTTWISESDQLIQRARELGEGFGGTIRNIAGAFEELGSAGAMDFLWTQWRASALNVANDFIEVIYHGLAMAAAGLVYGVQAVAQIVGQPYFWQGMGVAVKGVLIGALAEAGDWSTGWFRDMFPDSSYSKRMDSYLNYMRGAPSLLNDQAGGYMRAGSDALARDLAQTMEQLQAAWAQIDTDGSGPFSAILEKMFVDIAERADSLQRRQAARLRTPEAPFTKANGQAEMGALDPEDARSAGGAGRYALAGTMAQAVNYIMGRESQSVVADETKMARVELQKQTKLLESIAKKLPAETKVAVEAGGRFVRGGAALRAVARGL